MGFDAIKLLLHSHFTLFLQNEEVLADIFMIVYPNGQFTEKKEEIMKLVFEMIAYQSNN
jgi:hypothetical protein